MGIQKIDCSLSVSRSSISKMTWTLRWIHTITVRRHPLMDSVNAEFQRYPIAVRQAMRLRFPLVLPRSKIVTSCPPFHPDNESALCSIVELKLPTTLQVHWLRFRSEER